MINRGRTQTSQYIYNSKTGMLEKKEDNLQTIESLSKQARKQVNKLSDIGKEINKAQEIPKPINQITVITSEDNLIHNYFYDFEYSWDMNNCLSVATIKMPRINTENINYWATYQGPLTIYGGHDLTLDKVNQNSHQTEQEAANSLAQFNDISDIKPLFRGNIARIKEYQTHIVLYVDSIGVRFKQKIPDEFRQSFINNQNVGDAFQAICEFLGVPFICPPKTATETEADAETTDTTQTDGTENDVTKQKNIGEQVAQTAKNKIKKMQDSIKNNKNNKQNNKQINNLSDAQNPNNTQDGTQDENQEDTENSELTDNQEIDVIINGYNDVSFDANGAIVHGSAAIETSPDMADTLLQMEEHPLEKYLEDETGIIEKVQKFLDGDMFEELHNNVMDYGAITIEPKSTTTSEISGGSSSGSPGDSSGDSSDDSSNNSSQSNGRASSRPKSSNSLQKRDWNGWHGGQYYIEGKIHLSDDYIRSLTPSQAWAKYQQGLKTGVYRDGTMNKLLAKSFWQPIK